MFMDPWWLLFLCVLMCPCFYTKKKERDISFNRKDVKLTPSSHERPSSVKKSEPLQIIPASPMHPPGSPLRPPGSPLHPSGSSHRTHASPLHPTGSPYRLPGSPSRGAASSSRVPSSPSRFSFSSQISRVSSENLSFHQIAKATHNFSPVYKIGEGGFGTVYKAVFPDGEVVAVKRATKEHFPAMLSDFFNEVELLAKIDHMSLVRFLGFIDTGNEKLIITEYVSNGTLREHLDAPDGKALNFSQRMEIAIDIAHGLTHLHLFAERMIIHRDVKSSNILITENFRAKVADFGFAKVSHNDTEQTHISTKVKGTFGYLDPEYLRTNQLTPKSDVFSYGVLLIEILSGRRPVERTKPPDERLTVKWAFKSYNEGRIKEIMDPLLREEVDENVLSQLFNLAFRCASSTRNIRPAMNEVGHQLWEIRRDYNRSLHKN
ncbi:calmodulin-binding receptor-like cytoplasmic kinase 3 [Wolffia australiana]